jgi:hypothetical protein
VSEPDDAATAELARIDHDLDRLLWAEIQSARAREARAERREEAK